jgi:pimeloyl-ACP methyl ester carboxylesterase
MMTRGELKLAALAGLCLLLVTEVSAQAQVGATVDSEALQEPAPDLFARDSYRIDTVVCPFKGDIEYEPGDIECGLLEVPENRENPDSRFIELHFVKINSRWGKDDQEDADEEDRDDDLPPGKRDDPVIYLTGGPGARVNYYVGRLKDHTLLKHRDLYILEQRGIGFSDDFCPYYGIRKPATDDVETFDEHLAASHQRKADCSANATASGVDLTGYSTIENARDVKALRRALGFDQWNVWGISYGSILGQAYIKEDPGGILAVALDAIMPLEIRESELYWRIAHWYNRDLEKLQEICQRQPACAKRYPDIGGRLREAIESVVGNPIEVDVKDIENYPSGKARIFQDIVAFLPFVFLYEQVNYPAMPSLIYTWADAVERRDENLFKAIASASGGGFGDSSQGMSNAIFCLDGDEEAQARAGRKDLQEYPVLGAAIGSEESYRRGVELCLKMGMPQRPADEFAAVQTSIPSLIIEGDMDPITPPPNARAIMPGFEQGTYVEFPYAGHGPSRSVECAGSLLNKFYDNPTAEPDLSCVDEMEEPEIWAPMFTTSIAPRLLVLFTEDKKRLAIPGAWAGLSILIVLVAFLHLTFLPLGRILGRTRAAEAGHARVVSWLASLFSVASVIVFAAAFTVTAEASELLLIFGLVPWAAYGAWLGLLGGLVGLVAVVITFRTLARRGLPLGSWFGMVLTGLAAVSLSAFMLTWGLGPF